MSRTSLQLTSEQEDFIVNGIIFRKTIVDLCKELEIDKTKLFYYIQRNPDFEKRLNQARVFRSELAVDQLETIADGCETLADAAIARLKSDNTKWVASKLIPHVYGDNINLNVNHSIDLGSVLLAAANRVAPIIEMKRALQPSPSQEVLTVESVSDRSIQAIPELARITKDGNGDDDGNGGSFEDLL